MSLSTSVVTFSFVTQPVRIVMRNGDPWFVAADVAAILDYRMASDLTRVLDEDEKDTHSLRTLGGDQEVAIINDSGLYTAIIKSRKPEAKKFKKWVTSEVLPAIRKTGRYELPRHAAAPLLTPEHLTRLNNAAWLLARPFYMHDSTRLWFLKYVRQYIGVTRVAHIPISRFADVIDFLDSQKKPIDHYLNERIKHERAWLTQSLKRELDKRLGWEGPEFELLPPPDKSQRHAEI